MSTPVPTSTALQAAAAKQASLLALMTTPLALQRYDAAAGAYTPAGTVYAYLTTPTAGAKAFEDKLKLQVPVGTDIAIGDRFDYEDWHWKVLDWFSILTASIPVAIQVVAERDTPVAPADSGAAGGAVGTFATINTRRDGLPHLVGIGAEVTKPGAKTILPSGEAVDYLINVPVPTDIEQNDVVEIVTYAGYTLPIPDELLVVARTWTATTSALVRQLLARDTQFGGL